MPGAAQNRSQRLQFLLKLKISGATDEQMFNYCKTHYGVGDSTANDYIDTVNRKAKLMK